jgi:hypothetical protein
MKLIPGLLLFLMCGISALAVTIGPETPLNYNALQAPEPKVRMNIGTTLIRVDQEAQISPLFTSLMPAALEFGTMDLPLESADGLAAPKGQILNEAEAGTRDTVADLLKTEENGTNVVAVIGMALPSREVVADIARLTESAGPVAPSASPSFPAAAVLSMALLQRS